MKIIENLAELKKMAIAIDKSVQVCCPPYGETHILSPDDLGSGFEGTFNCKNGITAFVSDNIQYVIPHMPQVMAILSENGFGQKDMYVPFSNGDYPVQEKEKWVKLLTLAILQLLADSLTVLPKH